MNRKTMMTITSVLSIVFGALMIFIGLFCLLCYNMTTIEMVEEALVGTEYTEAELTAFVDLVRGIFLGAGIWISILSVVGIVLGCLLLNKANKRQNATGLLVGIIVASLFVSSLITVLFAILSLCAKFPEVQTPNGTPNDPFNTNNPEIVLEDINKDNE